MASVTMTDQALVDYQDIDEATADVDYSQSARIPLNGWYSKNIDVNGESRALLCTSLKLHSAVHSSL